MGGKASTIAPDVLIPADVDPTVGVVLSSRTAFFLSNLFQALSHDPAVGAAYLKDPFVRLRGSLRGVNDMLSNVCRYLNPTLQGSHRCYIGTGRKDS